ncbi:protein of unknown function [Methanoculleus bourgensis]|uniref:Uncharacterized protein n=1 Tax=Methanoculleus bourgensis TaxID=83986 RepID=A0A0X3BQY3_9EURY|nr:protein of unknown function [Methanoculleus bourgensis]
MADGRYSPFRVFALNARGYDVCEFLGAIVHSFPGNRPENQITTLIRVNPVISSQERLMDVSCRPVPPSSGRRPG